jgi:hypothetical protein
MKSNKIAISLALAALVLAGAAFVFNGPEVAHAQVKATPYPKPQPTNRILWDFDSGWMKIKKGEKKILNHNLGGDQGDYFVFLTGKCSTGIHNALYGGCNGNNHGCQWQDLSGTQITVHRRPNDDVYFPWEQIRIRILKNQ